MQFDLRFIILNYLSFVWFGGVQNKCIAPSCIKKKDAVALVNALLAT